MESLFAGFSLLERHFTAVLKGLEKVKEMADASVAKPEGDGEPGASGMPSAILTRSALAVS
ncbi:MAG: hypothetical protein IPM37_22960 [Hahellaceae bacterium]|nr:hypothetical protein [Hahellaceae bacterium]